MNNKTIKLFPSVLILMYIFCALPGNSLALEASTTLTVVSVPSGIDADTINYTETVNIPSVEITYSNLCFEMEPYTEFPVHPVSGACGRLWKFWSEDNNRTFKAAAWDFFGCSPRVCKHRGGAVPNYWYGVMVSSLCGVNPSVCLATERSNIHFLNAADPNY